MHALAGRRRDPAQPGDGVAQRIEGRARVGQIEFGDDDDNRALEQGRIPGLQFVFDRRFIGQDLFDRFVAGIAAEVQPAQKAIAEAGAFVRALDQTGNVDHHKRFELRDAHDAQLRLDCGERVVGDLRTRRAHDAEQRRLAGIRQADDAGVGEQFQFEFEFAAFAELAIVGEARRLPRRGREMLVAQAAAPAFGDAHLLVGDAQVGEQPPHTAVAFEVQLDARDQRPDGDAHDQVVAGLTGFIGSLSGLAGFGPELFLIAEVDQRPEFGIGQQQHVAAAAAVAAGRSAFGHVLLTAPRDDSVAALAGRDRDARFVDELHGLGGEHH